jgi:glycosyltransferase involved in cell wall biosynthesis
VLALRALLKAEAPDVIVSILTNVNVGAVLATRGLGFPLLVNEQVHPPCYDMGRTWHTLRRLTYPFASRVVMLTPEGCDWLAAEMPSAKGVVIPNPVQRPLLGHAAAIPPHQFVSPNEKLLLAAGRLVDQKGFDLLISAFRQLPSTCTNWKLVILGEGQKRRTLTDQIATLGMEQRVFLPGAVGNIGAWYDATDLYVLSSRFEGFPGVLGEAMAHGCPVVAYDCDTGPRSMVREGIDGVLVEPTGDVSALAEALARVMIDDGARERMASRAAEILDRYSIERILEMWDREFEACSRSASAARQF